MAEETSIPGDMQRKIEETLKAIPLTADERADADRIGQEIFVETEQRRRDYSQTDGKRMYDDQADFIGETDSR